MLRLFFPEPPARDPADGARRHAETGRDRRLSKSAGKVPADRSHLGSRQPRIAYSLAAGKSAVTSLVRNVLDPRCPAEIVKPRVASVSVVVAPVSTDRARAHEKRQNENVHLCSPAPIR